ncbi:helix-turn-helix domain-containing protein [Mycolicibacterium sp. XJ870]
MEVIDRFEYLRLATNHSQGESRSGLKPNEIGVLVAVWNYADWNTAEAYPSIKRLAAELNIDKSTVSRTLDKLCAKGWLREKSKGNSSGVAAVYVLTIPRGCTDATRTDQGVAPTQPRGCTDATGGCTDANQLNQELNQETKPIERHVSNARMEADPWAPIPGEKVYVDGKLVIWGQDTGGRVA